MCGPPITRCCDGRPTHASSHSRGCHTWGWLQSRLPSLQPIISHMTSMSPLDGAGYDHNAVGTTSALGCPQEPGQPGACRPGPVTRHGRSHTVHPDTLGPATPSRRPPSQQRRPWRCCCRCCLTTRAATAGTPQWPRRWVRDSPRPFCASRPWPAHGLHAARARATRPGKGTGGTGEEIMAVRVGSESSSV